MHKLISKLSIFFFFQNSGIQISQSIIITYACTNSVCILIVGMICDDIYSNQGQLLALLASQKGISSANGVLVLVSSFLAITCSAKFLLETLLV